MADIQLVVFRLGAGQFAAPIEKVREILRVVKVTRMPRTAPFLKGLFNLRGQVLPLVDTTARLGLAVSGPDVSAPVKDSRARVMVVDVQNEGLGLIVDEVIEVLRCDEDALQSPDNVLRLPGGRFLSSVADLEGRLVLVLDLDSLVRGAAGADAAAA